MSKVTRTERYVYNISFTTKSGLKMAKYRPFYSTGNKRYFKVNVYGYSGDDKDIEKCIIRLNNEIVKKAAKKYCNIPEKYTHLLDYDQTYFYSEIPKGSTIIDLTEYV